MDKMRATIAGTALATAVDLTASTLDDGLRELLQNARRAGATEIDIDTRTDGILRITDNGHGMLSPEAVLTYGMTAWRPEIAGEQPTGMGLFSLADGMLQIETRLAASEAAALGGRPRGPWLMTIQPNQFRGGSAAALTEAPDAPRPHGTGVSLAVDRVKTWWLEELVRFFPIPVRINGEQAAREAPLDGAGETVNWAGLRIGLFDAVAGERRGSVLCWRGVTNQLRLADNGSDGYAQIAADECPGMGLTRPGLRLRADDPFTKALAKKIEDLLAARTARRRRTRRA